VVIGGNGCGTIHVDHSASSSEFKRKGKGKMKDSSSIDSLRSDALKEFIEVSHLKKESLQEDQWQMSGGGVSPTSAGSIGV
jgi:hypothetical protein